MNIIEKGVKERILKGKQRLVSIFEICLWLDEYEYIFSDFDHRAYNERALSVDFLEEAKRASRDKSSGQLELKLMIAANKRNFKLENQIKKRLKEHFSKHAMQLEHQMKSLVERGAFFIICGVLLMFIASVILFKFPNKDLLTNFLVVLLEPGGWFFFWEGLDQLVFDVKSVKPDLEFYHKMANCEIIFLSY